MAIEVSAQNPRSVKALMIFAACAEWQTGKTKDGRSFFAIPSCSEDGLFHMVDARACTCRDFVRRGGPCKHVLAVKLWLAAFQTGAVAPKPRLASPTLADELIALSPAGAGFLAEQAEPVPSLKSYRQIYPGCAGGCGDLADIGLFCSNCSSDREYSQRMSAKRERVAARSL